MGKWLAMLVPENSTVPVPHRVAESHYHGLTLVELEREAADDWPDIRDDPEQLDAFAHALSTTRTRQRGERPDHYTKAAECAYCGPVWLWEGAPGHVSACPWCLSSGSMPQV